MSYRKLTPEEVFHIFIEEHRLCSPLDPEADPYYELTPDSTITEWREARDLIQWKPLAKVLNHEFDINIDMEKWEEVLEPAELKEIKDVCQLIAEHALIEEIKPIKILGKECISAAIFRSIQKNLSKRGIETNQITPSSRIEPLLKNSFGEFISHINKTFPGALSEIVIKKTKISNLIGYFIIIAVLSAIGAIFWKSLIYLTLIVAPILALLIYLERKEFKRKDGMISIEGIDTFRDLINKIIEKKLHI